MVSEGTRLPGRTSELQRREGSPGNDPTRSDDYWDHPQWAKNLSDALRAVDQRSGQQLQLITLEALSKGEVDTGRGVRISAITSDDHFLIALRFTHDLPNGDTCTKTIPIAPRKRKKNKKFTWGKANGWIAWEDVATGGITLSPSVVCNEHDIHGYVTAGEWITMRQKFLDLPRDVIARRLISAVKEADEYGGGEVGMLLALASHQWGIR